MILHTQTIAFPIMIFQLQTYFDRCLKRIKYLLHIKYYTPPWSLYYYEMSILKSILVIKDFQAWRLI